MSMIRVMLFISLIAFFIAVVLYVAYRLIFPQAIMMQKLDINSKIREKLNKEELTKFEKEEELRLRKKRRT